MQFILYSQKLDAIKYLAQHRRTGSRQELARRLSVSERTISRMIKNLREQGYIIKYNRFRECYELEVPE